MTVAVYLEEGELPGASKHPAYALGGAFREFVKEPRRNGLAARERNDAREKPCPQWRRQPEQAAASLRDEDTPCQPEQPSPFLHLNAVPTQPTHHKT